MVNTFVQNVTKRVRFFTYLVVVLLFTIFPPFGTSGTPNSIQDANGKTVTIGAPFSRIISLYSAHTENLCSLGAEQQLIGISRSDDFPDVILDKPRFSYREDPEKFIAAAPDLVLVRPMIERSYPQFIKKLRQADITVISLQPKGVKEMFSYWQYLGILSGKQQEAEKMVAGFRDRLATVQHKLQAVNTVAKPRVYFQSIHTKSKTFAPQSIGIFVLEQAGGINIGADAEQVRRTNIAYYGTERLLSKGSSIDIFLAQVGRMNPVTLETIVNEPGYQAIKAVREGKVYLIEEQLVSRPTLRIADGIEKLLRIFYPEFTTTSGKS